LAHGLLRSLLVRPLRGIVCLFALACSAPESAADDDTRAERGADPYPFAGYLVERTGSADWQLAGCSAFLLRPQLAATEAHCVWDPQGTLRFGLALGDARDAAERQRRSYAADWVLVPWRYDPQDKTEHLGDLALLHLAAPVPEPVPTLEIVSWGTIGRTRMQSIGYGSTDQRRALPMHVHGVLHDFQILVTDPEAASTCPGDSGSPLVIDQTTNLVGIEAGGDPLCRPGAQSGYVLLDPWRSLIDCAETRHECTDGQLLYCIDVTHPEKNCSP
jgi:V8-like Glu-specific endopeptidase